MLESAGTLKFSKSRPCLVESWDYGRKGILECRNWKLEETFEIGHNLQSSRILHWFGYKNSQRCFWNTNSQPLPLTTTSNFDSLCLGLSSESSIFKQWFLLSSKFERSFFIMYEFCLLDPLFILQPLHELICSSCQIYLYLGNKFIPFSSNALLSTWYMSETVCVTTRMATNWPCPQWTGLCAGSSLSMMLVKWLMNKISQVWVTQGKRFTLQFCWCCLFW